MSTSNLGILGCYNIPVLAMAVNSHGTDAPSFLGTWKLEYGGYTTAIHVKSTFHYRYITTFE